MNRRGIVIKAVAATVAALVVVGAVGTALWLNAAAGQAWFGFQQQRQELAVHLQAAAQQGYTPQDLAPVTSELQKLDARQVSWWSPNRPTFYRQQAGETAQLDGQLTALEHQLYGQAQAQADGQVNAARAEIGKAQQSNAVASDVQPLQQRLDATTKQESGAQTVGAYRATAQQAQSLLNDTTALYDQTQQENQAVQQAGAQLLAQMHGSLGGIQQAGRQALPGADNDASVAYYLHQGGMIKGFGGVERAYERMQTYAGLLGSGDVNQAAEGAAAMQRYAGQIHSGLVTALPAKAVIVSFQAQHVWAYQNGQVVMDAPVTTGLRGSGSFGTDFGPMKVLFKSHPWKMHSPWPPGSPHWYPDTTVQWTTFFTNTGEAFHDAYWEPNSDLGPGSQYTQGLQSHGCVHMASDKAEWMFNWAADGMPVVVYPGDGSSVANQLAQITTSSRGVPQSAE